MYARLLAMQKEIVTYSIVDKNVTFLGCGFLTAGDIQPNP